MLRNVVQDKENAAAAAIRTVKNVSEQNSHVAVGCILDDSNWEGLRACTKKKQRQDGGQNYQGGL